MKSPAENIKARLSSANLKYSPSETNAINNKLKKINIEEDKKSNDKNNKNQQHPKSIYTVSSNNLSRSNSTHKLDMIADNLQTSMQRQSNKNELDQRLGDYCLNVVNSVKNISSVVDHHKANYNTSQTETQRLLEKLKQADVADAKLRQNKLVDELKVPKEDLELVKKIWFEEFNFQKSKNTGKKEERNVDRNGNLCVKPSNDVPEDKKNKLLATLRAIDNGEVLENVSDALSKKTKVMKEIFGESDR